MRLMDSARHVIECHSTPKRVQCAFDDVASNMLQSLDDGKHVWSESKAFCTRYGGGSGGSAAAVTTGASSGRM
jgi:hypothetical protein